MTARQLIAAAPGAVLFGLGWWLPFAIAFAFGG